MSDHAQMYELRRNSQTCSGDRSCGLCGDILPGLKRNGSIRMAGWAKIHNEGLIDEAIMVCPVGALEIKEI